MYFVVYTSYAALDFSDSGLKALLLQSRRKNEACSVTGLLLYFDQKFLQLIEGEESEIKNLYKAILEDKRHTNVVKLKEGTIENRFFADWAMGYKPVAAAGFEPEGQQETDAPRAINTASALKLFKILASEK